MPTEPMPRVLTRQRAFLLEHGFELDTVVDLPIGATGVRTIGFPPTHPWYERTRFDLTSEGGTAGYALFTIYYPDDATQRAALKARDLDWQDTVSQALNRDQ
jgi:hypothetical protein